MVYQENKKELLFMILHYLKNNLDISPESIINLEQEILKIFILNIKDKGTSYLSPFLFYYYLSISFSDNFHITFEDLFELYPYREPSDIKSLIMSIIKSEGLRDILKVKSFFF